MLDLNHALTQQDAWRRSGPTAESVRQRVHQRAREFVEWLFPHVVVHRSGRFAVVGDISGTPGESLHIELTGDKAGCWRDWAVPGCEGKDLIGLYMASMRYHRRRDFERA